jgi:hypothetical protein
MIDGPLTAPARQNFLAFGEDIFRKMKDES